MNRESSFDEIAVIIRSAVEQAVFAGKDLDYAIEIAQKGIDILDRRQKKITFATRDALRNEVQKRWGQGPSML